MSFIHGKESKYDNDVLTTIPCSKMIRHISKIRHVDEQLLEFREKVWCCAWQHAGKLLATCGEDKTVKVWKYVSITGDNNDKEENNFESVYFEALCTIRGDQKKSIRCVCFSPCGRYLAAASFDATIIIYEYERETNEFEELHRLEGHESEVKCCAFSISGHYLATCSRDKSVWVWKVDEDDSGDRDCEVLSILQQHTADVKFVVWHPGEDILLSGGYDCSIRFYTFDGDDWSTSQAIPNAHDDTIWSAAFEPSIGRYLVTVGGDKCVRIWARTSNSECKDVCNVSGQSQGSWQQWHLAVNLQLTNYTRWPLYSVAWSQPLNQHQQKSLGTSSTYGILAVGGGDRVVRFFTFDEHNQALVLFDSIRLDSEINFLSWRPAPESQTNVFIKGLEQTDDAKNDTADNIVMKTLRPDTPSTSSSLKLAVAVDYGYVHLLEVGGHPTKTFDTD